LVRFLLVFLDRGLYKVWESLEGYVFLLLEELLQLSRVKALKDVRLKIEIFLEDIVVHWLGVLSNDVALIIVFLHLLHELVKVSCEVLETSLALTLLALSVVRVLSNHLSKCLHGHGWDSVIR
jgi:hypothetical protein